MANSKLVKANEAIAQKVVSTYQKVEDGVVGTYQSIERTVVGAYRSIEEGFVDRFLTRDGETVAEAKARLAGEQRYGTDSDSEAHQ